MQSHLEFLCCWISQRRNPTKTFCYSFADHRFTTNLNLDRTKGIRESTYFETGLVGHVGFSDPFSNELGYLVYEGTQVAILISVQKQLNGPTFHKNKTLVCMEGPAFSTRAESHMYRSWGCDIINMSCVPEAKLAREAGIYFT